MIIGQFKISDGAVHTSRDSYLLDEITVVSARRPLLAGAGIFAAGFGAFAFAFGDLLYVSEILSAVTFAVAALGLGIWIGELKLLSRDLRGSELSGAIWGSYAHLNRVRHEIVAAMRSEPDRQCEPLWQSEPDRQYGPLGQGEPQSSSSSPGNS